MSEPRGSVPPSISIQLYSLREASRENFDHVLTKLSQIGYQGVEPFNLFGKTPSQFRQQVEDLGMQVSSTHIPWINNTNDLGEAAQAIHELGLTRAPGGFWPDDFKDADSVARTIETTATLVEDLAAYGLQLMLHNHYWEFNLLGGVPAFHYLQDAIPDVLFEIDTYWAANFGAVDPACEIQRIAHRVPLMHVKDGPLVKNDAHVAVGSGAMDIPSLFNAVDPDVFEWAVVELDKCDTDMWVAVTQSYEYLTLNNLVQGNV